MLRRAFPALLLIPAAAPAAERSIYVGSFDKLRVQGPYEVTVTTGASPGGTISGDRIAIEQVQVRQDGSTVVIRPDLTRSDARGSASGPIRLTLSTPGLVAASTIGSSRLKLGRMKGDRVELSVSGTGSIAVEAVDTPRLVAAVIGSGTLAVAGKAASVQLIENGTGTIDAAGLEANDLTVRLDGAGAVRASARVTAQVSNTGLGEVNVTGAAKCRVVAQAGGPVSCGASRP